MSLRKNGDISPMQELLSKEIFSNVSRIHFIGVGGVSMYSLARLTLSLGISVSGSDREDSDRTRDLSLLGAEIYIGHRADNVRGADLTVFSHAIPEHNFERLEAVRLGIPTVSRSEYLGLIMQKYGRRIGVSGTHGKSTVTAMLDHIFSLSGVNPTTLSGADLPIGGPLRLGGENLLIYEACEYKDSFLNFNPTVAVALNLELDHTDYFADISALKDSFCGAIGKASDFAVINGDDRDLRDVADRLSCRVITFGGSENNDYRYSVTAFKDCGFEFSLSRYGSVIADFRLNVPGVFNVGNATAAIITALEYGLDVNTVSEAISSFFGISRRLEYIGNRFGRRVYYDYAHHPTEIAASINALKLLTGQGLTVIFRPHTYSRTRDLWRDFVSSLALADRVIICDIFAARETPIDGITAQALAKAIGSRAVYLPEEKIIEYIDLHTEGAIALMGAGDLEKIRKSITNGG